MDKTDQLRQAQLYIAEEIKRVCQKNGIKYFIDCGSMLGAVRHKGFIPWDDDMDFGMLKADYDRFVEIAPRELKSDFFLDEYRTNKTNGFVFGKVRLKGTKYIENKGNPDSDHNEIFVDIFPYIYVPEDKNAWNKEAKKLAFLGWTLLAKAGMKIWQGDGRLKQIVFFPTVAAAKVLSFDKIRSEIGKIINKTTKSSQVTILGGSLKCYLQWVFPVEILREFEDCEFEGHTFPIPKEYDRFLTIAYGDYMQIPPVEQRVTHEIKELDLGGFDFSQ